MIFTRKFEEQTMRISDGSCKNGSRCISLTDNPGTAIGDTGKCVLCCRFEATELYDRMYDIATSNSDVIVNPYRNISGDYNEEFYLKINDINLFRNVTGPFIRFNIDHYKLSDDSRGIVQLIPETYKLNWFSCLIDLERSTFQKSDPNWYIVVCKNARCSGNVLTILDNQSAIGVHNCVYNLKNDYLQCVKCKTKTSNVFSKKCPIPLINHGGISYTKCEFCKTAIMFDVTNFPQVCTCCLKKLKAKANESLKVCCYCNIPVNLNRRNGGKEERNEHGISKYYCKVHYKNNFK